MEKGLLFFTISIACAWLILDDFFGTKRLSSIVNNLTPDFQNPVEKFINGTATMEEKADSQQKLKESVDSSNSIKTDKAKKDIKDLIDDFYTDMRVPQVY